MCIRDSLNTHGDSIDIVILDMEMPGASGLEVARFISKHQLPITILVISNYDNFEYVKPVSYTHLLLLYTVLQIFFFSFCFSFHLSSSLYRPQHHAFYEMLLNKGIKYQHWNT